MSGALLLLMGGGLWHAGTSVDIMRSAVQCAKHVIGHINCRMPRTLGDGLIHISQFDTIFHRDTDIFEALPGKPSKEEAAIGK